MFSIILFLLRIVYLSSTTRSQPTLGLHPDNLPFYSGDTFTCRDNSSTIPVSKVNDDHCDCADCSDEPGTSAGNSNRFWCPIDNHIGYFISSTQVNDGIVDCCGGNDEESVSLSPETIHANCRALLSKIKSSKGSEILMTRAVTGQSPIVDRFSLHRVLVKIDKFLGKIEKLHKNQKKQRAREDQEGLWENTINPTEEEQTERKTKSIPVRALLWIRDNYYAFRLWIREMKQSAKSELEYRFNWNLSTNEEELESEYKRKAQGMKHYLNGATTSAHFCLSKFVGHSFKVKSSHAKAKIVFGQDAWVKSTSWNADDTYSKFCSFDDDTAHYCPTQDTSSIPHTLDLILKCGPSKPTVDTLRKVDEGHYSAILHTHCACDPQLSQTLSNQYAMFLNGNSSQQTNYPFRSALESENKRLKQRRREIRAEFAADDSISFDVASIDAKMLDDAKDEQKMVNLISKWKRNNDFHWDVEEDAITHDEVPLDTPSDIEDIIEAEEPSESFEASAEEVVDEPISEEKKEDL
ncbi:putative Glucosidase II beta subunit [Blattamonas nauphoetae]|uniref:Glucosidase II beta subunit n=1 Tax=Blattamonas nauphoetae TaxID=2049346 RepID=A0ABQ9WU96_9EUKA|nr:putative Glucosidase II beta subunit [Blattamonas nauphoetae]